MGDKKRPTETKQNQVQTTAPPSWAENLFRQGGANASHLFNSGAGGNVYDGVRVAPLSAPTSRAIGGLGSIPLHYQNSSLINLIKNPTSTANNLGMMASGGLVGNNPHFNQALQDSMNRVRDTVNSSFAGAGRYGSGAHTDVLARSLDALSTNAMANQYNQDVQNMMNANAMIDQSNQNQLGAANNFLQGYGNAYSNALQGSSLLNDYNQRLVDAGRERWLEQDNRDWNRLNMLMNAAHGFAGNYGTTTGNNTASLIQGNNPWKNAIGLLAGASQFVAPYLGRI